MSYHAPSPSHFPAIYRYNRAATNLRDTLLVLPSVQRRPGDPTRVLALKEQGLGLAILESENLAVTTDVELALYDPSAILSLVLRLFFIPRCICRCSDAEFRQVEDGAGNFGGGTHLARVDFLAAEGVFVGTHVGGVGAVPVVLVSGGLSS